jgi:exodeoxyribonuclease V alpha subunit
MTLRLAWHNDGWNGRICEKPAENTYCVGCASYPGEMIRERRDLEWERQNAGKLIAQLDEPPACMYSASAFAEHGSKVKADPPDFFKDNTEAKEWDIPPFTACIWPYEAMYNHDDLKDEHGRYDYGKRFAYAKDYFGLLEAGNSLIFYYANYSNPFSNDEASRYVLVGVARLKEIGDFVYYDGCSERTLKRYKGFVWQRNITSYYPEQGLRLPYHRYRNQPDILKQFVVFPENSQLCKYAARHVSDDQALGLLEQLLESVRVLRDDIQDDSENWTQRIEWLEGLIAELWRSRGAYPGMPAVLEFLGLHEAISSFRNAVLGGKEKEIAQEINNFCTGCADGIGEYLPSAAEKKKVVRNIQLNAGQHINILLGKIARCAITIDQLKRIMDEKATQWGITASMGDIGDNLYLLAEQYQGENADDRITWSMVDRGVIPSPDTGVEPLSDTNSSERTRAILLETLRGNAQQTFIKADVLLDQVNRRIKAQPEWKQNFLTQRYLAIDAEFLRGALYIREESNGLYLYDLLIWNQERLIEERLKGLLNSSDIPLPRPVTEAFWQTELFKEDSPLAIKARMEYQQAIDGQKDACGRIFNKKLSALTGGAGTGKSTVIAALIKATYKAHGEATGIAVIAPTGKATDRLRSEFNKDDTLKRVTAATIHSLLAKHGWLNPNMTFRLQGGKPIEDYSTIILDECSMIDLSLMAALFRAVNWSNVQRLILVGDPAQLPPIGVGKVFADIVQYIRNKYPEHLAELKDNLRQMLNRVEDKGNGILGFAQCFINQITRPSEPTDNVEIQQFDELKQAKKDFILKLHEGGIIDKDLRVEYWSDAENLAQQIVDHITQDISQEKDATEQYKFKPEIWGDTLKRQINAFQILSPVRGELYGTEVINTACQNYKSANFISNGKILDGITFYDKVIQYRNRPESDPLYGYDFISTSMKYMGVYNGEIGMVLPHKFDEKDYWKKSFRFERFAVRYPNKKVGYGKNLWKDNDGKYIEESKPEDNLELGYAISVHKSQGSEFDRIYFVLPESTLKSQAMELVYTALTRASRHCTVYVQGSVETLINAMRPEQSALKLINSSLFTFQPVPEQLLKRDEWYKAGKVHSTLTADMVRSKSEVIIANLLHSKGIDFTYEKPLPAPDGSMMLPDFTIKVMGETFIWEHWGMLSDKYRERMEEKKVWYQKHFPHYVLLETYEYDYQQLTNKAEKLIDANFN